jgi:hypothetical protein
MERGAVRRLLILLAVLGLAAGAGLAVGALTGSGSHPFRVVDAESGADMSGLKLTADPHVTPLNEDGLRPGSRFGYSFRVTNTGKAVMRHIVVRSVKVASPATGGSLAIASISDPACWGVGHSECIFQRLKPGETRTVRVTAESSARDRPGDRLVIRTFAGRFSGPVGGSIPLEVVGDARVTTGRFR